jgi:Transglycosylase SLT domain
MRAFECAFALLAALSLHNISPAFGQHAGVEVQSRRIDIAPLVTEAAQRFGLPEDWIYAVMRTESAGRIKAVSSAGAMGLMQLMPGTWARQRSRFGLGSDPFDPRDNILAGTSYLREMYDSYGASGFLAAYNAGPGRYEDWRDRGRPLPAETRNYVAKISNLLQSGSAPNVIANATPVQPTRGHWTASELFAVRAAVVPDMPDAEVTKALPVPPLASPRQPDGLFAPVAGGGSQ